MSYSNLTSPGQDSRLRESRKLVPEIKDSVEQEIKNDLEWKKQKKQEREF